MLVLLFVAAFFVWLGGFWLFAAWRGGDVFDDGLELFIEFRNVFAGFFPAGLELTEYEAVFGAADALEIGENVALAALATSVAQVGDGLGIAFASKDAFDDGFGARGVEGWCEVRSDGALCFQQSLLAHSYNHEPRTWRKKADEIARPRF